MDLAQKIARYIEHTFNSVLIASFAVDHIADLIAEGIRQNREDEALWWQKMYVTPHGGPCSCVPCVRVADLRKKTDKGGK